MYKRLNPTLESVLVSTVRIRNSDCTVNGNAELGDRGQFGILDKTVTMLLIVHTWYSQTFMNISKVTELQISYTLCSLTVLQLFPTFSLSSTRELLEFFQV